jgi:hypothetical protein
MHLVYFVCSWRWPKLVSHHGTILPTEVLNCSTHNLNLLCRLYFEDSGCPSDIDLF